MTTGSRLLAGLVGAVVLTLPVFSLLVPAVPPFWAFTLAFVFSLAVSNVATSLLLRVTLCPFCGMEHPDEDLQARAAREALHEYGYGNVTPATAALLLGPPSVYLSEREFPGAWKSRSGLWASVDHPARHPPGPIVRLPFGVEMGRIYGTPKAYQLGERTLRVVDLTCPPTTGGLGAVSLGFLHGGWPLLLAMALRITSGAGVATFLLRLGAMEPSAAFGGVVTAEILSFVALRILRDGAQTRTQGDYVMGYFPDPIVMPLSSIAEQVAWIRQAQEQADRLPVPAFGLCPCGADGAAAPGAIVNVRGGAPEEPSGE